MKNEPEKVYQFKITLDDIEPEIWRRIQVPETFTFEDLHIAIQDAMPWEEEHLHEFEIKDPAIGDKVRIGIPDKEYEMPILDEQNQYIKDHFSSRNKKALYIYDFGDNWKHIIILERILPQDKEIRYPVCLDGARACPPEDSGGPWGYADKLEVLKNKDNERYVEVREWIGKDFDPEYFDPKEVVFSGSISDMEEEAIKEITGKISPEEFENFINTPLAELDNFTPLEMNVIIDSPFDELCPIKIIKPGNDLILKYSPAFKIALEILSKIGPEGIKLTPKGNLPVNFVKEVYDQKYFPDEMIESNITKLDSEEDWMLLHNLRIVLLLAGLTKKKYGKLFLTKKSEGLLKKSDYSEIFIKLLKGYSTEFNWAYNDAYEDENIGHVGFLFMLHMLKKYGDVYREIKFYADLYFLAFPWWTDANIKAKFPYSEHTFGTRFFERFALWFGFAEPEFKDKFETELDTKIKKTELLDHLLK